MHPPIDDRPAWHGKTLQPLLYRFCDDGRGDHDRHPSRSSCDRLFGIMLYW